MIVKCSTQYAIKAALIALFVWLAFADGTIYAQVSLQEDIGVIVRPYEDSILVRWAPLNVNTWITGNRYGYIVERYTIVRDGRLVNPADHKLLTTSSLKPLPEADWEKFINNKYALITAQALYGETFDMKIEGADVMQIVNKTRENEQRYSIALFCADMSPVVARASALSFTDGEVERNVKYLYRVKVMTPSDTLKGSVFVDTSDKYILPAVTEIRAVAKGNAVMLQWNAEAYADVFTTYLVERSDDGKTFSAVSDVPGVTLSKSEETNKYQYVTDTVPSIDKTYYYRIKGITPFGEYGPVSESVPAKGNEMITDNVFITSATSIDNKVIDVAWDFPVSKNNAVSGFQVLRAEKSSGKYIVLNKSELPNSQRTFTDVNPLQTNYYKVKATARDGTEILSMPYLAMLIDSVPPVTPKGLTGKVDDAGNVTIRWNKNTEADIQGYRVYRAYYASEEFALLTGDVWRDTVFTDKVRLKTLNEKVYYRVMAVDRNQNQSPFSELLSLTLPDQVPPMPPVWLPVRSGREGVTLSWQPGGSADVVKYELFRWVNGKEWKKLATIPATEDSVYAYTDSNVAGGEVQYYTVIAVDDAQLESSPAPAVTGLKLNQLKQAVVLSKPSVDREKKTLTFTWVTFPDAAAYRIYRQADGEPLILFSTVKDAKFIDHGLRLGSVYQYAIVTVFSDGSLSEMSKVVEVKY